MPIREIKATRYHPPFEQILSEVPAELSVVRITCEKSHLFCIRAADYDKALMTGIPAPRALSSRRALHGRCPVLDAKGNIQLALLDADDDEDNVMHLWVFFVVENANAFLPRVEELERWIQSAKRTYVREYTFVVETRDCDP